jgi:hypothetical protein
VLGEHARGAFARNWLATQLILNLIGAAAQTAATAVSRGALFGSLALVLGAIAAWLGGRMGAVDPTLTTREAIQTRRPQLH